ncbi:DUF2851 family protein [Flagellimonas sp. HMM57]|uniref:DUF2851 family protein n=1 Tax=unclassified Flagellimonas TaxID=2644544 RepID=UPI0013D8B1CE|nr:MULTISPECIES: DUF2851 family protein [unclassified Flagellimonas]UII76614.1 DUF2851 family protein [Flagellimonas sp. HMM57]
MREDLLYYIWRNNKLQSKQLLTTDNEILEIKDSGFLNQFTGPDFFNSKVYIDGQLWAGNVEMHIKSSDWYAHHHETDSNYDNVILHVVWDDDIAVFRKDGSKIPTLELKKYVPSQLLDRYRSLLDNSKSNFINCEHDFVEIDTFLVNNWLDRLYFERLEQKSSLINNLLQKTHNDWEAVLFVLLMKNFGTKVNGDLFLERASKLDFSIIRKTSSNPEQLESLLFGHLGLLQHTDNTDAHYLRLKKEYRYLAHMHELSPALERPNFFGLRPINFPTIRLSQLAKLYAKQQHLFATLMEVNQLQDIYAVFQGTASVYWETHFTFGKVSKKSKKRLSKSFIDLLIINTIVPLKFSYAKHLGKDGNNDLYELISTMKSEQNTIIKGFQDIGSKSKNALESQSKIQLYTAYCSKNKCLQCALGVHLLNRNT